MAVAVGCVDLPGDVVEALLAGVFELVVDVVGRQRLFWDIPAEGLVAQRASTLLSWVKSAQVWPVGRLSGHLAEVTCLHRSVACLEHLHCALFVRDGMLVHLLEDPVVEATIFEFKFLYKLLHVALFGL